MLEVNNVSKSFGKVHAVTDLSFSAQAGAVFGLLGPNGAGKTTSIRMILDILEPDQGDIRWNGMRVNAEIRHTFGYLPEERGLYPKMRINDQLIFFARLHGMTTAQANQQITRLTEAFGLQDAVKKTPLELSKGNQQKIQFIAAIVHAPPLLVLDEPFAGLDPINVELFKTSIRELVSAGTTILLSSHRMDQVEELCRDICIIDRSMSVVKGNLAQIKRSWPQRFIRMTSLANMDFLGGFPGVRALPPENGLIKVETPANIVPADVLREALKSGTIDHFEVMEPSLTDIYLHYVRPEAAIA